MHGKLYERNELKWTVMSFKWMNKNRLKIKSKRIGKEYQPAFNCSNSTIETLEQGVKYVQS